MSEEAAQEAEALEAIFAEDFEKHSAEAFTLAIRPATGSDGACHGAFRVFHVCAQSCDSGVVPAVGIRLRVTYLPGYPETAPDVVIEPEKGLDAKQLVEIRGVASEAIAVRVCRTSANGAVSQPLVRAGKSGHAARLRALRAASDVVG